MVRTPVLWREKLSWARKETPWFAWRSKVFGALIGEGVVVTALQLSGHESEVRTQLIIMTAVAVGAAVLTPTLLCLVNLTKAKAAILERRLSDALDRNDRLSESLGSLSADERTVYEKLVELAKRGIAHNNSPVYSEDEWTVWLEVFAKWEKEIEELEPTLPWAQFQRLRESAARLRGHNAARDPRQLHAARVAALCDVIAVYENAARSGEVNTDSELVGPNIPIPKVSSRVRDRVSSAGTSHSQL